MDEDFGLSIAKQMGVLPFVCMRQDRLRKISFSCEIYFVCVFVCVFQCFYLIE